MAFGCSHRFEYSQGHFQCSKCGKIASEKQFKRNNNGKYATLVVVGLLVIGGIYAYANYDLTVDTQKISKSIGTSFNNISEDISNSIPINMEQKPETVTSKLEDCSKYKNEIRDGTDMEEAYVALQKTKACEQRNKQIEMQQELENTVKSDNISMQTTSNKIKVGWQGRSLYGEFTPSNLIFVENPRYNEIRFTVTAKIIDLEYDKSLFLETQHTILIDENSKKYTMSMIDCGPLMVWIVGKTTDTASFMACFEVGKDVKKFDIMFNSFGQIKEPSISVKIGSIQIKN